MRQRIELDRIWMLACKGAAASLAVHGDPVPARPMTCPLTLDELLSPDIDPPEAVRVRGLSYNCER